MRIRYIVDYPNEIDVTPPPEGLAPEEQCRDALINYLKTAPASAFSWWPDEAVTPLVPAGAPSSPAVPSTVAAAPTEEAAAGEADPGVPLDPEERARILKQAADIASLADAAMERWEHNSAT